MTTWNPSDKAAGITLTTGNTVASINNNDGSVRSTTSKPSGKFYFEVTATSINDTACVGIADASEDITSGSLAVDPHGFVYFNDGEVITQGTTLINVSSYTSGDIISVAIDITGALIYFAKNGTWQNGSNPSTGSGGLTTHTTAPIFAAVGLTSTGSQSFTENFGSSFTYSIPTGFTSWDANAKNVTLTGVSATGNPGTMTITSANTSVNLLGVSATGSPGVISKSISPFITLTGVAATGTPGNILVGNVYAGSLTVTESPDVAAFSGGVVIAGTMAVTGAADTASIAAHYAFLGWTPATVQAEVWTNK